MQKYVTAIHRRKLVKNCGERAVECHSNGGAEDDDGSGVGGGISPSSGVGSGAPEKNVDCVLRNVELYAWYFQCAVMLRYIVM